MGFGLLFLGYCTAMLMSINVAGSFIRIIGYSLTLAAAVKLSGYNKSFTLLSVGSSLMLLLSAAMAVGDVTDFMYEEMLLGSRIFPELLNSVLEYAEIGLSFAFNSALIFGVYKIARETEVNKICMSSVRNFIFVAIYYVLLLISHLPFKLAAEYTAAFGPAVMLLYFVYVVLILIMLFSCYARICDEADVDMEQKPSRFEFVNRFRAESEQRRLEADKRRRELEAERRSRKDQRRKK